MANYCRAVIKSPGGTLSIMICYLKTIFVTNCFLPNIGGRIGWVPLTQIYFSYTILYKGDFKMDLALSSFIHNLQDAA
jgi:hypothetical protein